MATDKYWFDYWIGIEFVWRHRETSSMLAFSSTQSIPVLMENSYTVTFHLRRAAGPRIHASNECKKIGPAGPVNSVQGSSEFKICMLTFGTSLKLPPNNLLFSWNVQRFWKFNSSAVGELIFSEWTRKEPSGRPELDGFVSTLPELNISGAPPSFLFIYFS